MKLEIESKNWVVVGSGKGLSHVYCEVISCTNADLLFLTRLKSNRSNFSGI